MRMLVTGAGGFIGRAAVAVAASRGHRVRAMLRTGSPARHPDAWTEGSSIEVVRGDIRDPASLREAVRGVDAVVHLAASMRGGDAEQTATTVAGTGRLLDAMAAEGAGRLVLVSSLAVYDVRGRPASEPVDESCRLETCPEERDAYCRARLAQEALVRDDAARRGLDAVILRAGVVYGPDRLWSPRIGLRPSPRLWLIPRPRDPLPLTFVDHCAEAIVLAAEREDVRGVALNVVDDDPPSRIDHARRIRDRLAPRPVLVVVPWGLVRLAGTLADRLVAAIRGRRPGGGPLSARRLAARFTPRPYANAGARARLGWAPQASIDEVFRRIAERSVGGG